MVLLYGLRTWKTVFYSNNAGLNHVEVDSFLTQIFARKAAHGRVLWLTLWTTHAL